METKPTESRVFYFALGIVVAYMLARAGIKHINFGTGKEAFQHYDLAMTLPRLLGFAACIAVARRYGGWSRWGWRKDFSPRGILLLLLFLAGFVIYYESGARIVQYTNAELVVFWIQTIPVALFEEACFRGLVFLSLRQRYGIIRSALISSAIFMVYHWQAQPLYEWPMIFLYGVIACGALELGTGLVWIALVHEVADSLWFHIGATPGLTHPGLLALAFMMYLGAAGLALRWSRQKTPA